MGCDIHMYQEYKYPDNEHWQSFGGRINPGRDYQLFEAIAGVRGEESNAIFPPRGLPKDISYMAEKDAYLYISETNSDQEGYCTPAQAESWVKNGEHYKVHNGRHTWVSHPDWHSHSWLTALEFEEVLNSLSSVDVGYWAIRNSLRTFIQHGYEARIVFWFDS